MADEVRRSLMEAASSAGDHLPPINREGALPNPLVDRLSPAAISCERPGANPCLLDVLTRVGHLPEGLILGEEAHRMFVEQSGLLGDVPRSLPDGGLRAEAARLRDSYRSISIEGELNRQVSRALVELGASSVAVVSHGRASRRLRSIPEVKDAIRSAWLSPEGLERQVQAASNGDEIPTWPVLILAEKDGA